MNLRRALTVLLLSSGLASAQEGSDLAELATQARDRIEVTDSGLLDVRLDNVNIFDALEMLSEQTKVNIVAHQGVSGTVSMVLRKVTFEEALAAILEANDLAYEVRDNIVYVSRRQEAAQSEQAEPTAREMRVFRLSYVSAAVAEEFITPLLSPQTVVTRTVEPEVGIESDKESAGGFTPAGGEVLIVVGPPGELDVISAAIAEVDVRPQQVLVEATIMRATLNEQNALGIDFNTLYGVNFQDVGAASNPSGTGLTVGSTPGGLLDDLTGTVRTDFNSLVPAGGFTFGIIKDQVAGFIRALEQVTDVSVMANPKILTLNKQRGEVIVGRRDGYLTTTVTETVAVQTVEYLETGTKLIFRPFITRDGFVRMEIHPEDSNGGLTAANLPFQETTEATTNILLRDGHTILIGGLFRERSSATKSQMPFFGNVPILGHLFGVQQDSTTREEVIILLTVHVLSDSAEERAAFEALGDDLERLRIGMRRGLMGTGRELLAQSRYQAAVAALRAGKRDKALWNTELALHLLPRHLDAVHLRERLLNERTWESDTTTIRPFVREIIRAEAGLPPTAMYGRPSIKMLVEELREPERPVPVPEDLESGPVDGESDEQEESE